MQSCPEESESLVPGVLTPKPLLCPCQSGEAKTSSANLPEGIFLPAPTWPLARSPLSSNGVAGESRARVENASGFWNPLETAVLESYLLWVLPPPKGDPFMTQTPGTGRPLSSVACLGMFYFPKLLRVWEAGSPERKRREHILSPMHPMPT